MEEEKQEIELNRPGKESLPIEREQEIFLDVVNDASSIFCDEFPPLPDFHCLSSPSTSSSAPPVGSGLAAASSSSSPVNSPATPWAVIKSDADEDAGPMNFFQVDGSDQVKAETTALSSSASLEMLQVSDNDDLGVMDSVEVMGSFGREDLLDSNEIWGRSSVFQNGNDKGFLEEKQNAQSEKTSNGGLSYFLQGDGELRVIFLEWLKKHKDCISAEDVRGIKLKRSTIENASKRLGSTKEGKKQLLKLILEWVGQFQLKKKLARECGHQPAYSYQETGQDPHLISIHNPNSNLNCIAAYPDPYTCVSSPPWIAPSQPTQVAEVLAAPQVVQHPVEGCSGNYPYSSRVPVNPSSHHVVNGIPFPLASDYSFTEQTQLPPSFVDLPHSQFNSSSGDNKYFSHQQAMYRNPCQTLDQNEERLGSSATKEARKKRMARQRRPYSHHNHHISNSNHHQDQVNDDQHVAAEDFEINSSRDYTLGTLMSWSSGTSSTNSKVEAGSTKSVHESQMHSLGHSSSDRKRQGRKVEKNLKFLLQKVLKQSDVGSLGRIVLPKKEAEIHLPELESGDGIPIVVEDIGTSHVWNMRYRYWPNNKSRVYLLENTGDFVRINGLQEGDFIIIYSDAKCGKFMIRGVKVRQHETKLNGKKPAARRAKRDEPISGDCSLSTSPVKQVVK